MTCLINVWSRFLIYLLLFVILLSKIDKKLTVTLVLNEKCLIRTRKSAKIDVFKYLVNTFCKYRAFVILITKKSNKI